MAKVDAYAIYLRKSRADIEAEKLGEGETLARHRKILTEFAAKKQLLVARIYQEIVSGETIEARPEMQKLIKDSYAGKYRGIIVVDISRLSRGNQGDAQVIMDCLKYSNRNNGLLVVTPTKTYDVAHNADDEEYMEFELFMSRREYKMIRKRLQRGKIQSAVEGNYIAAVRPYGYNIVKTKTSRTLTPNPDEAPIVKQIFEWTLEEKLSTNKIARRLDAMGIPTYSGSPQWSKETVKTILTNPVYIGKIRWNCRMRIKTMVDGKLKTSRPNTEDSDQFMLYDGKHEGIISEESFEAVSKMFYRDKTRAGLELVNPLAGLLVCSKCGRAMRYQCYPGKPQRIPRIVHTGPTQHHVRTSRFSEVMESLVFSLNNYIEDFKMKVDNTSLTDENHTREQISILQAELEKTEKKLSKLFDAWESDTISDGEFIQRKAVNSERLDSIKTEMEKLQSLVPIKENYQEKILWLSEAVELLLDETQSVRVKNNYLKTIIRKIEYSRTTKDDLTLIINLRDVDAN